MFEHQVKDMYASENVLVFSRLSRAETHFKHTQDHERARALTRPIYIIQNTITTVYEVESQETVNTKL